MTGRLAAARLLDEAQQALLAERRITAAACVGLRRLHTEPRCPQPPEPVLVDERDVAALAGLEAVPV